MQHMDYKHILGIIAILIALYSYIPYFRDIFLGKTKPHAFSWLIWSLLTGIAFVAQLVDNAGPGAWVTGVTALVCFLIFVAALRNKEKDITRSDWVSLIGAGIALAFWFITKGPLVSVILVTIIDALGFFPTFRKSFHKPHQETAQTFFLSGLKFVFAIIALENYTVVTWLYPLSLIIMNWVFVTMLLIRRNSLVFQSKKH